jgi:hypothetical protein
MMPPRALRMKRLQAGKTVREVAQGNNVLTPEQLERALQPWSMTMPGREKQ